MLAEQDNTVAPALTEAAKRLYRRYEQEVVHRHGLCPYAVGARESGAVHEVVLLDPRPDLESAMNELDALAPEANIDIVNILLPCVSTERVEFARWVERLRKAHAGGLAAVFALEAFHPHAAAKLESAERLTPFLRRTPDPMVQATRLSTLARVKRAAPGGTLFVDPLKVDLSTLQPPPAPISDRIADNNLATVRSVGADALASTIDDILQERDQVYSAIAASIPRRLAG